MAGVEKARASCNVSIGRSSATLVVVPPGLVQQWDDERQVSSASLNRILLTHTSSTSLSLADFAQFLFSIRRNSLVTVSIASQSTVLPL